MNNEKDYKNLYINYLKEKGEKEMLPKNDNDKSQKRNNIKKQIEEEFEKDRLSYSI
jgi:hypothetical protein